MTFLPIVDRELRIAARERKTYVGRTVAALGALIFGAYLLVTMRWMGGTASAGKAVFATLTHISFYGCLMTGALYSGDSISRENREGTLGLLFLTDLNGYDIILGKLAAGSLISFYALFATFPVLALPLMLGGVTWLQFLTTMLALVNSLFFAHSLALLVSTSHREAQRAISASTGLLWLLTLGLPVLRYLSVASVRWVNPLFGLAALFSPATAFSQTSSSSSNSFWIGLLCSHLSGWFFLACASHRAARCWKDKSVAPMGWRLRWSRWILGDPEFRVALRRQLLDRNAYLWLISRGRFRRLGIWITFGAVATALWFFHVKVMGGNPVPIKAECLVLMFALHLMLKMGVASESSRFLDAQRRNGELEMLLSSTPIRNDDIFSAHFLALKRIYLAPLIFVIGLDVLMLILGSLTNDGTIGSISAEVAYIVGVSCAMGMLLYDMWSLRWIGLWMGLSYSKPGRGAGAAFSRVFIIPFVLFALLQPGIAYWNRFAALSFFTYLVLWVGICIVSNAVFVVWARQKLQTDLRVYIVSIGDEPLSLLGRIGRTLGRAMRPAMPRR